MSCQVNMANNSLPGGNDALAACARQGVGLVAIKPFAEGRLLMRNKTVGIVPLKRGGGSTITPRTPETVTAIRCIAYTLSQAGVCTTVPGVRSLEELDQILSYVNATIQEKDYSEIVKAFDQRVSGASTLYVAVR